MAVSSSVSSRWTRSVIIKQSPCFPAKSCIHADFMRGLPSPVQPFQPHKSAPDKLGIEVGVARIADLFWALLFFFKHGLIYRCRNILALVGIMSASCFKVSTLLGVDVFLGIVIILTVAMSYEFFIFCDVFCSFCPVKGPFHEKVFLHEAYEAFLRHWECQCRETFES